MQVSLVCRSNDDNSDISTEFRQSLTKIYCWDDSGRGDDYASQGSTYNGKHFLLIAELGIIFPFGSSWIATFIRLQCLPEIWKDSGAY